MSELKKLVDSGQSVWLDNIRRDMLTSGTLARYIQNLSLTGLTSNPTIFQKAISGSDDYDVAMRRLAGRGLSPEEIFFELALEDLMAAADLFRPVYDATGGADGFASLEVSPALAYDAEATIAQARELSARAGRPNLLIKVPGTPEGARAIESLIAAGVPVNVTLLFSVEQYRAAAEAYLRGIERRMEAGESPRVPSVASFFISRWDRKTASRLPPEHANRVGIAVGQIAYRHFVEQGASARWQKLARAGALPQRLLWASMGVKDDSLPDSYYVTALAAEDTVDTLPEETLLDFDVRGEVGSLLGTDTRSAERVLAAAREAGIDLDQLAEELQREGAQAFLDSWNDLLGEIERSSGELAG